MISTNFNSFIFLGLGRVAEFCVLNKKAHNTASLVEEENRKHFSNTQNKRKYKNPALNELLNEITKWL